MPLDAEPNPKGNIVLDQNGCTGPASGVDAPDDQVRYISHFATCPGAGQFRRKP